ncbi:MAG: bifunctional aldolase/short-chain dehydrogenase [Planctomycetota bacterium]
MRSRWNDDEAREWIARHEAAGEDLALRVYTSRLIGQDPDLVLHGGGNTSVKTTVRDALGHELRVLCVKGSGYDLKDMEPKGLPAVELEPLLRLRACAALSDEQMVAELRRRLLDPHAPNPSVEALLHAFVPHAFVDHTHADAILALGNQPDGERLVRAALGPEVAILPWIMPGFPLAKAVAEAVERQPGCTGVVLLQHGIFTFGDTARQSYERMIALVDRAERFVAARVGAVPAMLRGEPAPLPAQERRAVFRALLPLLRAVAALDGSRSEDRMRVVADVRDGDEVAAFAAHPDAALLCATGPITPDHVIRTKGRYLFVPRAAVGDRAALERLVVDFVGWYRRYFEACARPLGAPLMLHPMPVVAVVEGAGLCALAPPIGAARIAADLAEHTLKVWARGHALGTYRPLPEAELAAMEYWPLELAKLGKKAAPSLRGRVALVTGAAGAIGCASARALLQQGACVCLVDRDRERLEHAAQQLRPWAAQLTTATADLCDPAQVRAAFDACVLAFGGVDDVVASHGIALVAGLEQLGADAFRRVVDANATSTLLVLQEAAAILRQQATGGSVVLQVSKNAFAPGKGFGAYSASKAAMLQLGRIAAMEFAEFSVRVNMVNADAVFGDDAVPSQLWAEVGPDRMKARGLDAEGLRAFYRDRSLLKRTVTPQHVADAVLFLVRDAVTTTGAVLPVDAGLPEAFPR